ncbi:hypothetical protein FBUS_11561 [Fasciolopsis buskii]|uniref:Uncharacterized protein n=1 Tax=Fasciolopsis buskii TaxID=27845 RepID=A0A8E0VF18_9TREM|nr:hypothetical protein FBUS_11561 [Fasciolopsis buski]
MTTRTSKTHHGFNVSGTSGAMPLPSSGTGHHNLVLERSATMGSPNTNTSVIGNANSSASASMSSSTRGPGGDGSVASNLSSCPPHGNVSTSRSGYVQRMRMSDFVRAIFLIRNVNNLILCP